jgi:hypothetical protein
MVSIVYGFNPNPNFRIELEPELELESFGPNFEL